MRILHDQDSEKVIFFLLLFWRVIIFLRWKVEEWSETRSVLLFGRHEDKVKSVLWLLNWWKRIIRWRDAVTWTKVRWWLFLDSHDGDTFKYVLVLFDMVEKYFCWYGCSYENYIGIRVDSWQTKLWLCQIWRRVRFQCEKISLVRLELTSDVMRECCSSLIVKMVIMWRKRWRNKLSMWHHATDILNLDL